tara:strand:+ start:131 stop:493 length:363 start_codon:yes stop_codon:yes gene_type:complete
MLDDMKTRVTVDQQNSLVTLEVGIAYAVQVLFVCRTAADVLHLQQALIDDIEKPYAPHRTARVRMDWDGDEIIPQVTMNIDLKQDQLLEVLNQLEEGSIAVFGKGLVNYFIPVLKGAMEQ